MYSVDTPQQLRTILRSMRQASGLTQAQLGERIGVTQKRIARIEAAPEVTAFDQIARMVAAMGHRLMIDEPPKYKVSEPGPTW
ncbi:MAG: helix-turn-helix transcriptional regulator [Pseudomonadota bacterium]|nr:helix-turn-helix transcriptional regulator [Pseudomonadota bacterium]